MQLEWTPERVEAFWNHYNSHEGRRYFSDMFGRSLIAYVRRHLKIGVPLDYGCGGGHLLGYLAETCAEVHGVEQSRKSRATAKKRLGAKGRIAASAQPNSADTAFLIEVVEHMDDAALATALADIHLALRPGGHLVITTPNDEDLKASEVMCPGCGSVFHTVQHVRSWDAKSLSRYLESRGFETILVEGTILSIYAGLKDRVWRSIKLAMGARPNLIYIGRKREIPS
jgi:2-polyprenyl-3-methyl-5-hydroxy-6-metoxy-1,4-benzoquinol methylase